MNTRTHTRLLFHFIFMLTMWVASTLAYAAETPMQKEWYSGVGEPEVWVSIKQPHVLVTLWSNIPPTPLQKVNVSLWKDYDAQYIVIKDFNRDGQMDIGVLEGADLAGGNKCYAVYEYAPQILSFFDKPSVTACE